MSEINLKTAFECWKCHKKVETVNNRNHWCKTCNQKEKELVENMAKHDSNFSEKVLVEKCEGRNWSAPNLGLVWSKPKERHLVLRRDLREYDIVSGIKRGLIRVVESEDEPIEPVLSDEIKDKVKGQESSDW